MTPDQFLKWSMDQYASMKGFKASCAIETKLNGVGFEKNKLDQTREIVYDSPNMFKIQAQSHSAEIFAESDGSRMVLGTSDLKTPVTAYKAPETITSEHTELLSEPMLCGTLLYTFFGGSPHYSDLVDTSKTAPSFGDEEQVSGEKAKHVLFYATGVYGHTDVLIGEKTGLVYRIEYDSDPRIKMAAYIKQARNLKTPIPISSDTVERYASMSPNPNVTSAFFVYNLPKGAKLVDRSQGGTQGPLPIGSKAPDFQLQSVDGTKSVRLSSLKGKTVLVDFWATWCGPCRQSLPHTEDLYKKYGDKDLAVVTVSDEPSSKIQGFLSQAHYTFPSYRDAKHEAEQLYAVDALPTVVIIDKKGNLASYLVGARDEDALLKALKAAGLG